MVILVIINGLFNLMNSQKVWDRILNNKTESKCHRNTLDEKSMTKLNKPTVREGKNEFFACVCILNILVNDKH